MAIGCSGLALDGEWIYWRQVSCGEKCTLLVLRADGGLRSIKRLQRPGDIESTVVPEDRTFSSWIVEISSLVEDFGGIGENEEAVGKAFRDPEELELVARSFGSQVESRPPSEVWGVAAEIDGDVPDVTGEYADELALRSGELVMQPAEDTFNRKRLIVLDELSGKTGRGKR
jgi:hypothetical protein